MHVNDNQTYKTILEISSLSSQLTPSSQSYVLNTINALLFSQQIQEAEKEKNTHTKPA